MCVQGPNGFFREFKGNGNTPLLDISCVYEQDAKKRFTGNVLLKLSNADPKRSYSVQLSDNAYQSKHQSIVLEKAGTKGAGRSVVMNLKNSHNWYDLSVTVAGFADFEQRYAGRVETGEAGFSDPLMGKVDIVASR